MNMAAMVLRLGLVSRRYWTGIQSGASVGYIKIRLASLSPHSVVSLLHHPHSHGVSRLTLSLCNKHQRPLTCQEAHKPSIFIHGSQPMIRDAYRIRGSDSSHKKEKHGHPSFMALMLHDENRKMLSRRWGEEGRAFLNVS
jgi:hypothetical protein